MKSSILSILSFSVLIAPAFSQLAGQVPPPPCLVGHTRDHALSEKRTSVSLVSITVYNQGLEEQGLLLTKSFYSTIASSRLANVVLVQRMAQHWSRSVSTISAALETYLVSQQTGPSSRRMTYSKFLDASAYHGALCSEGGFLDYNTTPPHFETVPPKNCTVAASRSMRRGLRA